MGEYELRDGAGRSGSWERGLSRRGLLLGGLGAVTALGAAAWLVEEDRLPGRTTAYDVLGLNGDGAPLPDAPPGERVDGRFVSAARAGTEVGWTVAYPPGTATDARLPVLLVLHGATFDHTAACEVLGMDRFLGLAVADGVAPFAIASADGGATSWRPTPGQGDASAMLVDELLPLLADRGLDTTRLVVCGWSMGGYGALRLVTLPGVGAAGVTVMSPALSAGDDVVTRPEALDGLPVRVDCGRGDPFYPVVEDFVAGLDPRPEGSFGAGGHTPDYWRTVVPDQLRFAARCFAP